MPSSTDPGRRVPTVRRVHTVASSPIGPLTLVAEGHEIVGLYMLEHRHRPDASTFGDVDDEAFSVALGQLEEYFAGDRTDFELPLAAPGTPFQRTVWAALHEIPYGRTQSYGWLAALIGRPKAARAVGLAIGRNPLSIVVPCHRVVGGSGELTGYGGGIERKRFLLEHERRRDRPTLV